MIRVGTRGSALALAQARLVASRIGEDTELVVISTAGDKSARPIRELGDGAFVTALEDALRRREVDVAIHSLKDVPTAEVDELVIAAIPRREDPRDVLVTATRGGLASLPNEALVGTSSPRRAAFLQAARPDVRVAEIRGNVDTRLRKVQAGEFDGTILALAGLRRLGLPFGDDEVLPTEVMLPAPGQGALAVQCRADASVLRERLRALDDRATRTAVTAERALLRLLGASCELALGALATVEDELVTLDAALAADGGIARFRGAGGDPLELAQRAADALALVAHAR
jgi:hydroxymethylbilane synthase